MNIPNFSKTPCANAITWLNTQRDAATAWQNCQRGDWMWWTLRFSPEALPEQSISIAFAQWCAQRAAKAAAEAAKAADWAADAAEAASWAVDAAEAADWAAGWAAVAAKDADWAAKAAKAAAEAAKAAGWAADVAEAAWVADWAAKAASWAARGTKAELVAQADWIRAHIPCPPI